MTVLEKRRRDALVIEHLALADQIARAVARRLPPSFDPQDLAATGYVALIAAAARYDPARGPFTPFARYIVRGAILDSVRRRNWQANTHVALDDATEPACMPPLAEPIDARARVARIAEAARWLPPAQRRVLALRYGSRDLEWWQIVAETGMSEAWVYAQHAAAIAEIRIRMSGAIPVARRLVSVAKPKLVEITINAAEKAARGALAAEVDELGALEKEFAPLRPKLARIELLRKSVRSRYDASPAGETFEAQGERFMVCVGARANESVIDVTKLMKLIGAKLLATFATVTLRDLEANASCSVRAGVVSVAQTGYRSLKTFEKGAPELPKAA